MSSRVTYLNDQDEVVDPKIATKAIMIEFDDKGNRVIERFLHFTD